MFWGCLFALAVAVSPAQADIEANKALGRRMFDEVWNQGAVEVLEEVLSDDYVIHDPSGDFQGAAGYRQFHGLFNSAFSDIHFEVEDQVAEGDWVATRWTSTSVHTGELMGTPATDKAVMATGITMSRMADGRIAEEWNEWHLMGLMEQIGAIPAAEKNYGWGEPSAVTGAPGDPLMNKVALISFTEEIWNLKRIHALEDTHGLDFMAHNPNSSTNPKDLETYRRDTSGFIVGMPDITVEMHKLIAEGDKVAIRYTTRGTNAASGKSIAFTGVNINRFADGKIVENWWAYDAFATMQQVMAPPQYSPVGTWVVTVPTPLGNITMLHTINPSEQPGGPHAGILDQVNKNPSHFGMFPEINDGSNWVTQTVAKGNNAFETTMLVYGTRPGEGPLAETAAIYLAHVDWTITGPNTNEGSTILGVYLAEQDGDGDGMPDAGEEPVDCQVFPFTTIRLNALSAPPCVPVIPEM
jgi:steroid delta-isomerase-like uncharacterized protein